MAPQYVSVTLLIADYKVRHGIDAGILRAVDFDHQIIHAERYTAQTWESTGRYTYPTCLPVPQQVIDCYAAYRNFLDMRKP